MPGCPFGLTAPVLDINYSRVLALKKHKIEIQLINHCQTCNVRNITKVSCFSFTEKEHCVYFFLCVCVCALNVSHVFIQQMCLCVFQNAISRQCKAGKGWILTVTEDTPPTPVTPVRQRLHPPHIHTPSTPPLLHPPCPQGRRSPPSPPHSLKVPPDEVMNCDHVYLGCASSSVNGSSDCGEIPAWIICIWKEREIKNSCMDYLYPEKNPCADYVWIDGLFTDPPFMDGEKTNWHQLVLCSAVIRYYITSCVELSILISTGDESCRTCLNLTLFICGITVFVFFACWCDKL